MAEHPENVPEPSKWYCGFAEEVMRPDYNPLPLALHVKRGVYYTQGRGFHNANGDTVIGLPGGFMTPGNHPRLAEEEVSLRQSLAAANEPEVFAPPLDSETRAELLEIGKTAQEQPVLDLKPIHLPTLDIVIEVIPSGH